MNKRHHRKTTEELYGDVGARDDAFLAYYANMPRADSGGHNIAAAFAREICRLRDIDYKEVEYQVGNYQGSKQVAVMKAGQFVRWAVDHSQ